MMMKSHSVVITTMCNMGVCELNFISLCETRLGGGMEAVMSLSKEEMAIFENDPELLTFISLNPAPL